MDSTRYVHTTAFAATKNLRGALDRRRHASDGSSDAATSEQQAATAATYVKDGRSLYLASNWMNCVKKGSVSLVVPMAMALPMVATTAAKRRMRSSTPAHGPRLAALRGMQFGWHQLSLAPSPGC